MVFKVKSTIMFNHPRIRNPQSQNVSKKGDYDVTLFQIENTAMALPFRDFDNEYRIKHETKATHLQRQIIKDCSRDKKHWNRLK